ncbi:MAG TPA: MoxR family ATPase [Actinomycetes bacterium]|jgi:MoxR-like ATPase|nr:MoxR family ATPase [Actinomycetes bacterium]
MDLGSPDELARRLADTGYLADEGLATAAYLAWAMRKPLFCEGEAGVGKTSLAAALAEAAGAELIRLQCYEGIDASQALYDWDFPRQLLHLRAAEAAGVADVRTIEGELYDRRFLIARPLLRAIEPAGPGQADRKVLLIDEVDRADDEFEAFLLEVLSDFAITVPELGTIEAVHPPVVVVTSNRTRDVHDALKRRCLYHWLDHPSVEREIAIIRRRLPGISQRLAAGIAAATAHLRSLDLLKPPGIAESLDWAAALRTVQAERLDEVGADRTLGAVLKHKEDLELVRGQGLDVLVAGGAAR